MVSQVANQIKAFAAVCGMILRITCNAKNDIYILHRYIGLHLLYSFYLNCSKLFFYRIYSDSNIKLLVPQLIPQLNTSYSPTEKEQLCHEKIHKYNV